MPTDEEWEKAFRRLSRGESSYREEGKKLGVHHSIVGRRFIAWLNRETEKRQSIYTQLKQNLDSLEEEYAKKKQVEEEKFRRATVKAEGEHKNRIADIQRATANAEEVHRKRMSELDAKFIAKREELRKAAAKTEEEHKKRMSVLDTEISAKAELLHEFNKVGLKPTQGLELLKRDRDLDGAIAQKTEQLEDMEKRATGLERRVRLANEQLAAWGYRFRSVQADVAQEEAKLKNKQADIQNKQAEYRRLTQNIQSRQAELDTISLDINNMKDERAELEPKMDDLRLMRRHLPKVQFLCDSLTTEVRALERTRAELIQIILTTSVRILQTLEAEEELAGDWLEKLQISLERLKVTRIEALGVQNGTMTDELMKMTDEIKKLEKKLEEKLEEKRRELETIPGLVAVGGQ